MNLRSIATRLMLVLSALCAFAFGGDETYYSFYLSADRIFAPGDADASINVNGRNIGGATVYFRAFRVDDPVDFFLSQKDPHSPRLEKPENINTFEMIRQGYHNVIQDVRYAAREVVSYDARVAFRDVVKANGVGETSEQPTDTAATHTNDTASIVEEAVPDVPPGAEKYEIVAEWKQSIGQDDDYWHYESVPVPIHQKGVYLVEARIRGKRAITAYIVSEYGMILKQSGSEAMAYVVNRQSGVKVSEFPLVFSRGGKRLFDRESAGDGVVQVTLPELEKKPVSESSDEDAMDEDDWRWEYRSRQLLVLGMKDDNFVISDPYYYGSDDNRNSKVYLHTDRPIYRPAQTVYYRGIARTVLTDGTYQNLTNEKVAVEITDARDGTIKKDTLELSDLGTFNGEIAIGEEPPLGYYSIKVSIGEHTDWFNFSVEEYKKPEYKVEVTTDQAQYTRGDVINATVHADYFFGSPVANAQVEYFVYRARYWRPWWRNSQWAYLYEGEDDDFSMYRQEMIHSGNGVLNPDGTYSIVYQTDDSANQDYVYRIQANVVDNSRRSISGSKAVEVTRGEFYISARTDKYVYTPGDNAKISAEIATFDGDHPVTTSFTVSVERIWWDKTPMVAEGQTAPNNYTYVRRSEVVWNGNGSTDGKGQGSIMFKPEKAGYFQATVTAHDRRGTAITDITHIYVADEQYAGWGSEESSDVQIIPDKDAYKAGETMNALVIMPAPDIDALITVEGATIYSHQVERLDATSAIIHIPIDGRYAPMFYLNASAIVNDQLYTESRRVTVVPEGKLITLEVKTDRSVYKPGDHGTMVIRAIDEKGTPVANADVAIGMVDEAIYSIQPDATPDIQRYFYGNRWNEVNTESSLNFSFSNSANAIDGEMAMYEPTASSDRFASAERGQRAIAYGDVKGEMFVQPAMRKNFKDMMSWTPSVRTGADGSAKLEVDFPDNLTTWRITARCVTSATAVGSTVSRVVARKDLMVRMETPRFLVQGDELLIATTVHNYLKSGKTTKVQLSGNNLALSDRERIVTIEANGEQRIDWRVNTLKTGMATLSVKALTNEESDAMELTIPVLPKGLRVSDGAVTDIEERSGTRTLKLSIPEYGDVTTGQLTLTFSPSLAGSTLGALDELIGYPYGCVEQTMSRFLPTIVVANTLQKLDIPFPEDKRRELPKMVARGLSKLYGMQHRDGGWGWWENDETDPFMTAYVMYGLSVARASGYNVLGDRFDNGLNALRQLLRPQTSSDQPKAIQLNGTTRSYMLYVLSCVDTTQPNDILSEQLPAMARQDTLNNYSKALLALACNKYGLKQIAGALATKLQASAKVTAVSAYWQGKSWHYNWEDDMVETSAAVVRALLEIKGESPLTKKAVRWLLSQKVGEAWHNTRQTAMVIYSLVDYLKSSGEDTPDYSVNVKVNGIAVHTIKMTKAMLFAPEQSIRLDNAPLHSGENVITITKSGVGRLYSAARLNYYATGPGIKSTSAGFVVSRQYYLLRKERKGDVYVYTKTPFNGTVKTGDEIFVKVSMTPDANYEYVMLEDPLPAGCEVVKSTDGYTIPGEWQYDINERQRRGYWGWSWWYADRDVRDEKVAFFARSVQAGQHEFSYIMRAQIPGTYAVMPPVGSLMYYPEVRGNGSPLALTITD